MYDFFVNHAVRNLWCSPNQDTQSIVKPARLTPDGGAWNRVTVLWRSHVLPLPIYKFHVFQIGQLHPMFMGLFPLTEKWITMAEACGRESLIVDIYNTAGIQYPRTETWYKVTEDRNIIIAIREQKRIPIDFNSHDVFIRVYKNAYYQSLQSDPLNDYIEVSGGTQDTSNDIIALQTKYEAAKLLPGHTYAFVNGFKVPDINLITTKPGDIAEYVYDSAIHKVVDLKISDLETFDSTLDLKRKYVLHYPVANVSDDIVIEYHDDVDVFLIKPGQNNLSKGVYYHRNQADSLRMLTHRDYSICVPYIVGFANDISGWDDPAELTIRLHVRKSGYARPLINESNRIKEMYKLHDTDILRCMIGVDSVVDKWLAEDLEKSMYIKLMGVNLIDITHNDVMDAYGYNAVSSIVANTPTPVRTFSNSLVVDVPHMLVEKSVAYEYDVDGKLLCWSQNTDSNICRTNLPNTNLVEMLRGIDGLKPDDIYGETTATINPLYDYRMYTCNIVGGVPDEKWEDVTGSGSYAIIGNMLTWITDPTRKFTLVRSNSTIMTYSFNYNVTDGLIKFSIKHDQTRGEQTSPYLMSVPMGDLDIFLNGKSLIEGLDYFVSFPEVIIVNKEYLVNVLTDPQHIVVRFSGFCNSDLSRESVPDVGFINHGLLSNNNRYDIRDDKVIRVVVDGGLRQKTQMRLSETSPGVWIDGVQNGRPYILKDVVVPIRDGVHDDDTYAMRTLSRRTDKQISDYMTLKLPDQTFVRPSEIPHRYQVFSPFCCKIIYDLKAGHISEDLLKGPYNDEDVINACKKYEYLLKSDLTQPGIAIDENWVEVHPHNLFAVIPLTIYDYKFITRVVKIYLQDKVSLSHFTTVTQY